MSGSVALLPVKASEMERIAALFKEIADKAEQIHKLLDSGEYLEGAKARAFWTREMRLTQADLLARMLKAEKEAVVIAESVI